MPNLLIVLACPPSPEELLMYRLEELATILIVLFPATLLLIGSIAVGVHAARPRPR